MIAIASSFHFGSLYYFSSQSYSPKKKGNFLLYFSGNKELICSFGRPSNLPGLFRGLNPKEQKAKNHWPRSQFISPVGLSQMFFSLGKSLYNIKKPYKDKSDLKLTNYIKKPYRVVSENIIPNS